MAASIKNLAALRASPAQTRPALEFLVVSGDESLLQLVAEGVESVRGRLNCASTAATARDYIARRRVDGIVVDMKLSGALEVLGQIRASSANRSAVVFACLGSGPETQSAVQAGANFALR